MTATTAPTVTETIISSNPATGEKLGELSCATPHDVHDAVARARKAQPAWAALPVNERVAVLRHFQQKVAERCNEIA